MNDIEAHIARTNLAQDGIQICTIVIQQASGIMHNPGYLFYIAFKHAQR